MKKAASRIIEVLPKPRDTLLIPSLALRKVTSKSGNGIYASADVLYKSAIFGRDSLEVAEDLIDLKPALVRNILKTMARLQGQKKRKANEEEPGKIIHEYRNIVVDGKKIKGETLEILKTLGQKWGGTENELAYYASVDSTPLFLRVLKMYCDLYGDKFLETKVTHKNGFVFTIKDSAKQATDWIINDLISSESGLLVFKRKNPKSFLNHVWKDSNEFYVHEDGSDANHDDSIASIEVQGITYDALLAAAYFFPENATRYESHAYRLRDRTISLLWQDERQYFALGLDYDENRKIKIIDTTTGNAAALLDTAFFDLLPEETRRKYITGIVNKIMSFEFLTDAGIRSRSLNSGWLIKHWDYHGSFVSWPKETFDIAKGLKRQGFPLLAKQLENRLLNVIFKHRQYPEFVYVDGWGRIMSSTPSAHTHGDVTVVDAVNNPEKIQAWTVSAIMSIVTKRVSKKITFKKTKLPGGWQTELEQEILSKIPKVNRHLNPFTLKVKYPTNRYRLNR